MSSENGSPTTSDSRIPIACPPMAPTINDVIAVNTPETSPIPAIIIAKACLSLITVNLTAGAFYAVSELATTTVRRSSTQYHRDISITSK
ncbi:hypothetical protein [Halorubrum sp. Atlit-28R]|uniref:hypothetical protein n=1 Tax=Halorubrum sp. Atlit-28R TaxID=2282129 RepID=UPI0018F5E873|nr:hypothetical protein [Halorubrum sp. Atlit-28R]